jgi:hypothetical protein
VERERCTEPTDRGETVHRNLIAVVKEGAERKDNIYCVTLILLDIY